MITWMQRHKKWLVVTIWISVIAFVGAGFVGWGDYDFNMNRSSSVAKVADEKISIMELNQRYSQVFSYYNEISNGTLTEQRAKESGLDSLALQSLIEDKLLISFAKRLGLSVSEDEILRVLINDKQFLDTNGLFDKNIYYAILAQNDIKPTQYESIIYDEILLDKLSLLFAMPLKQEELEMLASSFFMQDVLSIDVLIPANLDPKIDEAELKKFWEERKSDYTTQLSYELSTYFMPLNDLEVDDSTLREFYEKNKHNYKDFAGKIISFDDAKKDLKRDYSLALLRTEANAKFVALDKGEENFQKDLNISEMDIFYPLEMLKNSKPGTILRPFEFEQDFQSGYMIARVNKKEDARLKSFAEAREEILPLYKDMKRKTLLENEAKKALENFKGKNIGSVSRDSLRDPKRVQENIMNDTEFSLFLMNVFNQDKKKSYVLLDNKAILYEIKDQTLLSPSKLEQYKDNLSANLLSLKASQFRKALLKRLEKEYKIEIYYKGN